MPPKNNLSPFNPARYYHVFNRTNNGELLFHDDHDRRFFLLTYQKFVSPYVKTCAYCLIPNHFHLLIWVKKLETIIPCIHQIPEEHRTVPQKQIMSGERGDKLFHALIERQFTRWFTSYAMYFNKRYLRSGNLFYRPFKRVHVESELQLAWLFCYIHTNPGKHGMNVDFRQYRWSSYYAMISQKPTLLDREVCWSIFGDKANFEAFHNEIMREMPDQMWDVDM